MEQTRRVVVTGLGVISPVGKLRFKDEVMVIRGGGIGPVSQKLYDTITGIQYGRLPDAHGWVTRV